MNSKTKSKYLPSGDDFPKFSAKERIFCDIASYFGLFNEEDCFVFARTTTRSTWLKSIHPFSGKDACFFGKGSMLFRKRAYAFLT